MKVAVACGYLPARGGSMILAQWLCEELRERGHQVSEYHIPAPVRYRELPTAMAACRLMNVGAASDVLITCRLPAHALRHDHKNVWFWHHHRGAFDLWGTPHQDLPSGTAGESYRRVLQRRDTQALAEASNLFTNSRVVAQRVERFNELTAEVVYPPLRRPERYENRGYGDEIVYVSRVNPIKRQHLLIEALAHTRTPVRVRILGPCLDGAYEQLLNELTLRTGVADRVELDLGWVSEDEKAKRVGECLGVAYFPVDEDSYGYPSLEAQHAGKPVITTTDAGGTDELISHGVNGLIVEPTPQAIAAEMDLLWEDRGYAAWLGANGPARIQALGISWDHALERLLR
jgi:glycosyltransferase involved in cell wall biosynthesis